MQANPSAAGSKGCLMAVAISESQHLSSFSSHLNHFRQVTTGQEEHPWKNVNPESFIGVQVTHTKCRRYQSDSIITVRFHYIFAQVSCDTHRLPERGHRIWTSSFCPLPGCTLYIWSTRCHGVKGSFCSGWTKWTIWTKTSQVALKQIWLIAWSGFESNGWRLTKQVFWGCDSIVGCISHEEACEQPSVAGTTPHMQSAQAKVAENNRKHTKLPSLTRWRNPTFWSSTRNGPLSIFSDCTRPLSIFFLFTWWARAACRTPHDDPTGQSVEFNQAPPLPYQCNERLVTSKWIKMEHD